MGSSTNHVVRFDGLALTMGGEGSCSYTLLTVSKGVSERSEGSEVKLHTGPCLDSASYNHVCMKAMEVTYGRHTLLLKDDMTVSQDCCMVGDAALSLERIIYSHREYLCV